MTDWFIQHPIAIAWLLIFFIIGAIIGIALLVGLLTEHKEQKPTPAPPEPDPRYTPEILYEKIEMIGKRIELELSSLRQYLQEHAFTPSDPELPVKFIEVAKKANPQRFSQSASQRSSSLYVGDADE